MKLNLSSYHSLHSSQLVEWQGVEARKGWLYSESQQAHNTATSILKNHPEKVQNPGFFYIKGGGKRRSKRRLRMADIWAPAGVWGRWRNFFVLSLFPLVDVSLVMRFLQILDKQLLFLYVVPLSPQERHFFGKGLFCKTQGASGIPLMISMSICNTTQKLLAGRPWEQHRLEQDAAREAEPFTLSHQESSHRSILAQCGASLASRTHSRLYFILSVLEVVGHCVSVGCK